MKSETTIKTIGLTAILISAVYFFAYVKDNEFHKPVNNTANYSIVKR